MASTPSPSPSNTKTTFGQALGKLIDDSRRASKLGVVGLVTFWILRNGKGRQAINHLFQLGGDTLERAGIEAGPRLRDAHGWTVQIFNQIRFALIRAFMLIVVPGVLALVGAAYIQWGWLRGLVGSLGYAVVITAVAEVLFRWTPRLLPVAVAIKLIDGAQEAKIRQLLSNPLKIIFGAIEEGLPAGVAWILWVWKWAAHVAIWYGVGLCYVILVPLHRIPGAIPMTLPLIPLFFMIPLAEPWKQRAEKYDWILWAGVFWLGNLIPLSFLPKQLYEPLKRLDTGAAIIALVVLAAEVFFTVVLAMRSQDKKQRLRDLAAKTPRSGSGNAASTPLITRPPTNWTAVWMVFFVGLIIVAVWYLDHKEQFSTVVSGNLMTKVGHEMNEKVGGRAFGDGSMPGEGGSLTGDGAVPQYIQPTEEVKHLADGGVELTFPAAPGWCPTSFFHRSIDGPIQVEVIDSTYVWKTNVNGRRIERSVGGWPWYQLPKNSPQVELRDHYIEAGMMQGGLLMKHGDAQPFFLGAGQHLVWHRNKLGQSVLPEDKKEFFLAINIPQQNNMRLLLEGTITVRIRPAKRAAHSTEPPPHTILRMVWGFYFIQKNPSRRQALLISSSGGPKGIWPSARGRLWRPVLSRIRRDSTP